VAIPVGGAIQVVFREIWQHTRASPVAGPPAPEWPGDLAGPGDQTGPHEGVNSGVPVVRAADAPDPVP
jgi:hypothetical protein